MEAGMQEGERPKWLSKTARLSMLQNWMFLRPEGGVGADGWFGGHELHDVMKTWNVRRGNRGSTLAQLVEAGVLERRDIDPARRPKGRLVRYEYRLVRP